MRRKPQTWVYLGPGAVNAEGKASLRLSEDTLLSLLDPWRPEPEVNRLLFLLALQSRVFILGRPKTLYSPWGNKEAKMGMSLPGAWFDLGPSCPQLCP